MKKETKLVYFTPKNHEEWLEFRRHSIGGSDAAIIVGLNPFTSQYALWLDKTRTDTPEEEYNEAMRQGTDLESYVAERFTLETGKEVIEREETIKNPDYPFAHANVDRWVVGENAGLECKTTSSLKLEDFENGKFPPNYYIQCLHYMAVTGAEKYYLAVLVFGKAFKVFEIERDEELIEDLMKAEENFWFYVENDIAPPVDGSKATDEALSDHYSEVTDETVDLTMKTGKINDLLKLKSKRKDLDVEIKSLEQELKETLKNAQTGLADGYSVTWKKQSRRRFNEKKFFSEHPEIDAEPYYSESEFRVLRIKELT